ncbi:MAG: flagellar hook-basal body complex protein [Lachnospiraceae bacterium]|nr:flagellar hook-basal body complex protein [Lachnospiraceae bacterium]MBF1017924.1 flagellar hook-basal body complex protein [Lachnospiraceae bacterium]
MGITFGNTVDGAGAAINADGDTIHLKFNTRTGALESIDGYPKTTDGDKWKAALFHFNSDAAAQTPGNTTSGTAAPADIQSNVTAMVTAMGADTETTSADKTRIISMDFSPVTNNNTNSQATIKVAKGNTSGNLTGRQVGALNGLQVGKDGKVTATYTNGQTRLMGQIAVAQFANASGLEKEGNNLYSATLNSGEAKVMDVSEDGGSITTGVLEMSNVDLSNEFTSMITAQRGFQANSRIITVSDTLLEELVNLKR